jgi:hypothetical protein
MINYRLDLRSEMRRAEPEGARVPLSFLTTVLYRRWGAAFACVVTRVPENQARARAWPCRLDNALGAHTPPHATVTKDEHSYN